MPKRSIVALLLVAAAATASAVPAPRNAERSVRGHRTIDAWTPPDGLISAGLDMDYARTDVGPLGDPFLYWVTQRTVRLRLEAGPIAGLRLWADAPWHAWSEEIDTPDLPASGSGLGDPTTGLVFTPLKLGGVAALGLDLRRTYPAGDTESGLGMGEAETYLGLAATLRAWPANTVPEMRLKLNAGRLRTPDAGYGGLDGGRLMTWGRPRPPAPAGEDNDPLVLAAALEFRRGVVALAFEHVRYLYDDAAAASREEPRWWTACLNWGGETGPGLRLAWDVNAAVDDPATVYRPLEPDMVMSASLTWSFAVGGRDRDGDGLGDRVDPCPNAAEDLDGFRDEDGCPDPDNDEDGVLDVDDDAPMHPEDYDGFRDEDGRPDPDNDRDGILDVDDDCPDEAEDLDGHQDDDGCPEEFHDADGDGIPDEDDVCPYEPEDFDGFLDGDGCPDPDNDLDGILDVDDACPDEAEDYDGVDDEDGCPD